MLGEGPKRLEESPERVIIGSRKLEETIQRDSGAGQKRVRRRSNKSQRGSRESQERFQRF